ncbi:MAG: hypothetical protein HYW79_00620 [Parcubacteria group bacterium]|nr:hypothetical protein [Parcubacteria group bacterium]
MKSRYYHLKNKAVLLRKNGKTYGEIQNKLNHPISKSTLSVWFKNIVLSEDQKQVLKNRVIDNVNRSRKLALATNRKKREQYLKLVSDRVWHLKKLIEDKNIAKIVVAMLYMGEGKKSNCSVVFGNSDPKVISLFLRLLRRCYNIDENKFRCTLQCRADQDIKTLEKFWSKTTGIPLKKFYKAQIDPRTLGRPSKKLDYKGVCRIDYFSADIFNELMKIAEII